MGIYDFGINQQYSSIDKLPDNRSDDQRYFSPLSTYNHDSADIAYAERLAEEMVNISGSWVKIYLRTNNMGSADDVWEEDADPTYFAPKLMKGFFAPEPANIELTKWGIDSPNKTTIIFSRSALYKENGDRLIRPGDIVEIPHNTMTQIADQSLYSNKDTFDKYRVINAADSGNFKYRWLYWNCVTELITGDITIDIEHGQ